MNKDRLLTIVLKVLQVILGVLIAWLLFKFIMKDLESPPKPQLGAPGSLISGYRGGYEG